jgi:hypothetical protein
LASIVTIKLGNIITSNENMGHNYFTYKGEKHCFIPGYERKYSVTTSGKVVSWWGGYKLLKQHSFMGEDSSFKRVDLVKNENGKRIAIRRSVAYLVSEVFNKNPKKCKYIFFKDGDITNCRASNMIWVNRSFPIPIYEQTPYIKELPPFNSDRSGQEEAYNNQTIPDVKTKIYTKEEKQLKNPQAYEPWTKEDDENLELLFCEGKTVKELSEIFGRGKGAILSRIKKLELEEKYGV